MFRLASARGRYFVSLVAIGLCSLAAYGQDSAREKSTPPAERSRSETAPKAGNVADPQDLEAFFDGVVNAQLVSKDIAGAVVAVVADSKLVFRKGYGYADVEARRKVDPDRTLFRIASISKLFTWTAVMQQVEEGKLDLDTDVNTYLKDVKIPATYPQPITLRHLLTHTPGFEDYVVGLFSRKHEDVRPLAEVLNSQMPGRVRPPGVLASYSNHGTAIAGYAVACVSGMPWEEYVEKRILTPLGMEHTLTRQPAEQDLPADLSKGYQWKSGHFRQMAFEYVPTAPAGCISTSATDIARFMLAHLNDGEYGGKRILRAETAQRMREPLFRHDRHTSAMCYGFIEEQGTGQRMVGHGGDTLWFHSLLQLLPDRHVGFFVSFNTDTGGGARNALMDAFLKRYFPGPELPENKTADGFRSRAEKVAGEYVNTRYSHSTITKLSALLGNFDVSVNDDDTITIATPADSRRYVELEPFVYRERDGTNKVVFQEKDGRVQYVFLADAPPMSAIRREWYDRSIVHWSVLGVSVGVFVSAFLFWPAIAFSVRGLQSPRIKRTWFSAVLSCLGWLLSLSGIVFTAGLAYALADRNDIVFGLTPLLKRLLLLPPICAGLGLATLLGCLVAWINGYWRFTGRLHYTLVALAGVAFSWFLYNWNMLTIGSL